MGKALVIVESPAKAKTVNRYLGSGYLVKASMGHVCDLPKTKLGVDIKNDFKPTYQIIPERRRLVAELRKLAKECEKVILAADPDREGEAISWHISQLVEKENPNIYRAVFHEITEEAIKEAFSKLGPLDQNKINAQQTRRILDRLVGYLISPLLWKKIGRGLSAGRVQSVALRLICDREKEIKNFVPEEYWTIAAILRAENPPEFKATLVTIDGKKTKIKDQKQAQEILEVCRREPFILEKIQVKAKKKNPPPPYITSTMQQDAYRILRFPVKKTMSVAQRLYEGLELGELGPVGLITYMRTDSVRIADIARQAAKKYIEEHFGPEYVPPKPNVFKSRKTAQEAHEAIRPTHLDLPPEKVKPFLKKDEFELYKLIWNRFLASQMSPAEIEETQFEIRVSCYGFVAKGEVIKFKGFLALYEDQHLVFDKSINSDKKTEPEEAEEKEEAGLLPAAKEGEILTLVDLQSKQNFTQPPPRYTEATLVKELEARGIGRPSTYAPIIATLQDRIYVIKEEGRFKPTELGMFVTDFLVKYFTELFDYKFTAKMEEQLDRICDGEADWLESLRQYYQLLQRYLEQGHETESVKKNGIPVEDKCPKCGRNLVIKEGRYGRFKACSGYPECDYSEPLVKKETKTLETKCPLCGSPLVYRRSRYGMFIACSNYPKCKYVHKEISDTGIPCPLGCGGTIIKRKTKRGKYFYGCSNYPKCKFASWDEVVNQSCPKCGAKYLLKKAPAKGKPYLYCQSCDYVLYLDEDKQPEPGSGKSSEHNPGASAEPVKAPEKPASTGSDEKRD
ncbi:MAG: type I DNA topoisomerase [Candidatus Aminicenantes bacterium]|nr:type I DNA topoisomerase [Candidatus Aminicenantes bacterium]